MNLLNFLNENIVLITIMFIIFFIYLIYKNRTKHLWYPVEINPYHTHECCVSITVVCLLTGKYDYYVIPKPDITNLDLMLKKLQEEIKTTEKYKKLKNNKKIKNN